MLLDSMQCIEYHSVLSISLILQSAVTTTGVGICAIYHVSAMSLYCTQIDSMGMQVGEAKRVLVQSGQVSGDENISVAGQMSGLAISA